MNYLIGFVAMLTLDVIYLQAVSDYFGKIIHNIQKSALEMRILPGISRTVRLPVESSPLHPSLRMKSTQTPRS